MSGLPERLAREAARVVISGGHFLTTDEIGVEFPRECAAIAAAIRQALDAAAKIAREHGIETDCAEGISPCADEIAAAIEVLRDGPPSRETETP